MATGGALTTALGLNRLTKVESVKIIRTFPSKCYMMKKLFLLSQKMNPLIGRLVPVVAVAAANCINIPMMRIQ